MIDATNLGRRNILYKSLDKMFDELREDVKLFFLKNNKQIDYYGNICRRIIKKDICVDDETDITLGDIWNLRDNYRKELNDLCGRNAEDKQDPKMFQLAYVYLHRKLGL